MSFLRFGENSALLVLLLAGALFLSTGRQAIASSDSSLVGVVLRGNASKAPLTALEVKAMPKACLNIGMGYMDGVFWYSYLQREGRLQYLDLPENAMAKDAVWFHHYCWGILSKLRSISARDRQDRLQEINLWRSNMQFIVDYVSKNNKVWPYMAVVHTELANANLVDGKVHAAIVSANKALDLDPATVDAYWIAADAYLAMKNRVKAIEILDRGLANVPGSRLLLRRLTELGVNVEKYKNVSLPDGGEIDVGHDSAIVEERAGSGPDSTGNQSVVDETNSRNSLDQIEPESVNRPPYCRFCP